MRVNDDLYVIPLTFDGPRGTMVMNLSLVVDTERGLTLVDTGMPGQADAIEAALAAEGFSLRDVRRIVLTHQDVDHIGSLAELKARTGAEAIAHNADAPYIEGKERLIKSPSPERLAENPAVKAVYDAVGFAAIDRTVEDGDLLDVAGGVRVIFTPGHTPGHLCLFLERTKALIAGDALVSAEGNLQGPSEGATPDMATAKASVQKLAALPEVSAIVTYHGGLVAADPRGQLQRVAGER